MTIGYQYEVWAGKTLVGHHNCLFPLTGAKVVISEPIVFARYDRPLKYYSFELSTRVVSDNHIDYVIRRIIKVTRKNQKGIKYLLSSTS